MKITLFLLLFSTACLAQPQPDAVNPDMVMHWPDVTMVRPQFGKVHRVMIRKDHALYAEGIPDSTWITICYGCQITNTPPPVVQIDTIDGFKLVYTGWGTNSAIADPIKTPGWYKNTISYSTTGEAKYTFVGTGVELWGERLLTHGTGTVTVGTETKTVSWAGPKQLPAKIAEFKGLPQGQHTIVIKPISGYVLIDYLIIRR